ncbi:MAG: MBL fold metallo-hydrolase [Peptococcaceae bacterium]|jgi:L-ascorbate 6-phosphate lactonase|nr:MBL fold metallo-hydrolase [Peptococcaceae bacterium]
MFSNTQRQIEDCRVEKGSVTVWWLGQSGFAVKTPEGKLLLVDPYLTDAVSMGYKPYIHQRLIPPVLRPDEIRGVSAVLYTHTHMDHMDESTAVLLSLDPGVRFIGSADVRKKLVDALEIPQNQVIELAVGQDASVGDVSLRAYKAMHSPDAQSYLVTIGGLDGRRLYFCGDSVLFRGFEKVGRENEVDCAFLPINGQGGNMDPLGAAYAAHMLGAKAVVPSHYGMYADSTAEPKVFLSILGEKFPDIKCLILDPGEAYILK